MIGETPGPSKSDNFKFWVEKVRFQGTFGVDKRFSMGEVLQDPDRLLRQGLHRVKNLRLGLKQ